MCNQCSNDGSPLCETCLVEERLTLECQRLAAAYREQAGECERLRAECERARRDEHAAINEAKWLEAFAKESPSDQLQTIIEDPSCLGILVAASIECQRLAAELDQTDRVNAEIGADRDGWKRAAESQNRQWAAKCEEATESRAEVQRLAAELQTWRDGSEAFARAAEVERMRAENESLRDALNRDRTGLAAALVEVRKVAAGYRWIGEGEWGSYEWQERTVETLQRETGWALGSIEDIARNALEASGTLVGKALRGENDAAVLKVTSNG